MPKSHIHRRLSVKQFAQKAVFLPSCSQTLLSHHPQVNLFIFQNITFYLQKAKRLINWFPLILAEDSLVQARSRDRYFLCTNCANRQNHGICLHMSISNRQNYLAILASVYICPVRINFIRVQMTISRPDYICLIIALFTLLARAPY